MQMFNAPLKHSQHLFRMVISPATDRKYSSWHTPRRDCVVAYQPLLVEEMYKYQGDIISLTVCPNDVVCFNICRV
jgi:hypothetical protein